MKRAAVAVLLLTLIGMARCGDGQPTPPAIPDWANVAPEQIAEAKKHGVPVAFENDLGMRFVLIPAGTFLMGSPEEEARRRGTGNVAETQHQVALTTPFFMQITEVTYRTYRCFRPDHDAGTWAHTDANGHYSFTIDRERQPATDVTWVEASAFAVWLGEADGRRTCRLPTEAEWEYACRAGTRTTFAFGDSLTPDQATFLPGGLRGGRRATGPTDVGSHEPNTWGLYDLHGNASEWCADWVAPYAEGPTTDPGGPTGEHGEYKSIRGGNAVVGVEYLRCADRRGSPPDIDERGPSMVGIRLVSPLPRPSK